MGNKTLLDAIRIVKENERRASDLYAEAAKKLPLVGKELFIQLSEFEQYHYDKVTALEKSILEKGDYIHYEGRDFPLPPLFEIKAAQDPNKKSSMQVITEAMELEVQAEKAYGDLAAQVSDPEGHAMFDRLSQEEHKHYLILGRAYKSVSETGIWQW
jgi:rubrerythrin